MWLGYWWLICVAVVALGLFLCCLDDLFISLVFLFRRRPFAWPADADLAHAPQRRIAIFVPCWHEHEVIARMLRHNLAAILYGNYDIFVGVYANDPQTAAAVQSVIRDDARVHLAVCPHDGPTSKGDCLNWTYKAMVEYERRHGIDFEILITHDAEDLVHPESLRLINWYSRDYQMVQVPVLPLATGLREWTHGVYCDEFAEYQFKDIPVRQSLGGFLPSNGVGAGFERSALEGLRRAHHGRIFDPHCLTEDYDTGFRLFAAGFRQIFLPVRLRAAGPVATREYFPRRCRAAVRQRSRWVAGIALQGWERHGWRVSAAQCYWFWRDRKGLAANLIAPFANAVFLSGIGSALLGHGWWWIGWAHSLPRWISDFCFLVLGISILQTAIRVHLCARVYGISFAAAVPLRMFWANLINFAATLEALQQFARARLERRALVWRKTDHDYPAMGLPVGNGSGAPGGGIHFPGRPRLGEILIGQHSLSPGELEEALHRKGKGQRIGEYLVAGGKITMADLHRALASQAAFAPATGD
ncbi:MAG TPA: glycosyl transferase family protein [Bryobacteraceae bacterium]|nr:glycosyl transferase family protein [Bryobacteraceae bacterium]